MKQEAERSEAWSFRFPIDDEKHIPIEDKFAKLILITKQQGIKKENAVLAGMAIGLLIQIWEKIRKKVFYSTNSMVWNIYQRFKQRGQHTF